MILPRIIIVVILGIFRELNREIMMKNKEVNHKNIFQSKTIQNRTTNPVYYMDNYHQTLFVIKPANTN